MNDLLANIEARVQAIATASSYAGATGAMVHPEVFLSDKPPALKQEDSHSPFILIRIVGGTDDRQERIIRIQIVSAVFSETTGQGMYDLNDLTLKILSLQRHRGFSPYHLAMPVKWHYGDADTLQPAPFFYSTVELQFKAQPLADRS